MDLCSTVQIVCFFVFISIYKYVYSISIYKARKRREADKAYVKVSVRVPWRYLLQNNTNAVNKMIISYIRIKS